MAELLASAGLSALFGGGAAAGATAGGAAAAGGAVAAGSQALAILQGVASTMAAVGAIGTGLSAMNAANEQADATELQAGQEQLAATQKQTQMRRQLYRVLGENDVAFAAAGIEVGQGGIASTTRANATRDAASSLNIDRDQDEYRRALLKVRARGLRRRGGEEMFGGLANAAGVGLNYAIDRVELGV